MSARPTLALVIPAYNAARFLPQLFASIAAQTEPFDEIVLCDDASSDDTGALAAALGARVLRHSTNAGCSMAKNTGLAAIASDWVHFHDADDLLLPDFTRLARAQLSGALDVWLPRWRHVDAANGRLLGESALDAALLRENPVVANLIATINNVGVYRTALLRALGGFAGHPATLHNEDRAFHLALAEAGARFVAGDALLLETRRHGDSMSQANAVRCLLAHAAVTRDFLARHPRAHPRECAIALWQAATGLASWREFAAADKLVLLAAALGYPIDPLASRRFAALARLGPRLALRLRELSIRIFKPRLRRA